jgi:uncharacterized protein involved in exopolysaccharide biosynthesis
VDAFDVSQFFRRFWRLPVIGLLAGLLAFGGSFLLSAQYQSSTQILLRGRDTTFLTGTGEALRDQPLINDNTLATALAATQGALVSSRNIARTVVDQLDLDEKDAVSPDFVSRSRAAIRGAVARLTAFLRYGFYDEPDPYDAAVEEVYEGLRAEQVADSYIIELTATARDPETAAAIADAAADALTRDSAERFRADASAYRDFLGEQLARASEEEVAAGKAIQAFQEENGISDVFLEIELSTRSIEDLRTELKDTEVDIQSTQAGLDAATASLEAIAETDSNVSQIQTGRSTTEIRNTGTSSAYQQLVIQRETLVANLASLEARRVGIEQVLETQGSGDFSELEAQLRQLELQRDVATQTVIRLSEQHQQALLTAESDVVEITRLDQATIPLYPVSPKRYLFLLLGALAGLLGGFVLSTPVRRNDQEQLVVDLREQPKPVASTGPTRVRIEGFEMYRRGEVDVPPPTQVSHMSAEAIGRSENNEDSHNGRRGNAGQRSRAGASPTGPRSGRHRH